MGEINTRSPPEGGAVKENVSKNRGTEGLSMNREVSTSSKNDSAKGAPATQQILASNTKLIKQISTTSNAASGSNKRLLFSQASSRYTTSRPKDKKSNIVHAPTQLNPSQVGESTQRISRTGGLASVFSGRALQNRIKQEEVHERDLWK